MVQETIREAVGVFDDIDSLNAAVTELENTAFPRHDISVMGKTGGGGRFASDAACMEDNPDAPRDILIRAEEKTIGASVLVGGGVYIGAAGTALLAKSLSMPLLLTASLAGGLAGGLAGAGAVEILRRRFRGKVARQVQKGGLVLWVRTPGPRREDLAREILLRNGGRHIHVHEIT